MKIKVLCTTCATSHFDHYECDQCHHRIDNTYSYFNEEQRLAYEKNRWEFCPWCGTPLDQTRLSTT
jgi:hypothetical protein